MPERGVPLPIGKGGLSAKASRGDSVLGTRLGETLKAAEELAARGVDTVAAPGFAKRSTRADLRLPPSTS